MRESQSGTAFQAVKDSEHYIRGHPLLRQVCASVTHLSNLNASNTTSGGGNDNPPSGGGEGGGL